MKARRGDVGLRLFFLLAFVSARACDSITPLSALVILCKERLSWIFGAHLRRFTASCGENSSPYVSFWIGSCLIYSFLLLRMLRISLYSFGVLVL